jgi:hypothetical protein
VLYYRYWRNYYDHTVFYYNDVYGVWKNIALCAERGMGDYEDSAEPVLFPDIVYCAGTVRVHLYSSHSAGDIWCLYAHKNEKPLTEIAAFTT